MKERQKQALNAMTFITELYQQEIQTWSIQETIELYADHMNIGKSCLSDLILRIKKLVPTDSSLKELYKAILNDNALHNRDGLWLFLDWLKDLSNLKVNTYNPEIVEEKQQAIVQNDAPKTLIKKGAEIENTDEFLATLEHLLLGAPYEYRVMLNLAVLVLPEVSMNKLASLEFKQIEKKDDFIWFHIHHKGIREITVPHRIIEALYTLKESRQKCFSGCDHVTHAHQWKKRPLQGATLFYYVNDFGSIPTFAYWCQRARVEHPLEKLIFV